jgi:hypothetical protein
MSGYAGKIFTLDCLAVTAGLLIASPFVLVLISPFLGAF